MSMARPLTVAAHNTSYRILPTPGLAAGKAPSKIARLAARGVPYEQPLLEHIHSLALDGVAVDVGANVGNHTLWMAVMCGLRVHAFEPVVHAQLQANVELNGLDDGRVMVHPVALGERLGEAIHCGDGRLGKPLAGRGGDVPVFTLDYYGLSSVVVVKVDVEGMEPLVLRGAEATLRRCRPVVFAEEWPDSPVWHDRIAAALEPLGYVMSEVFSGRRSPTPVGKWEHQG